MAVSAEAINAALGGAFNIVDELFTTKEEKAQAKLKLVEMIQKGDIAQLGVNAEEAKNSSLFVAGWRPSVGWICVAALGLNFILFPIIKSIAIYVSAYTGEYIDLSALPVLDINTLGPILLGMLGLSATRSFEKINGVAK